MLQSLFLVLFPEPILPEEEVNKVCALGLEAVPTPEKTVWEKGLILQIVRKGDDNLRKKRRNQDKWIEGSGKTPPVLLPLLSEASPLLPTGLVSRGLP